MYTLHSATRCIVIFLWRYRYYGYYCITTTMLPPPPRNAIDEKIPVAPRPCAVCRATTTTTTTIGVGNRFVCRPRAVRTPALRSPRRPMGRTYDIPMQLTPVPPPPNCRFSYSPSSPAEQSLGACTPARSRDRHWPTSRRYHQIIFAAFDSTTVTILHSSIRATCH